ncbi:(2Fe-2S)-binding protein [Actinocrispum wychmicini]|uniref:FhuF-like iron-sulfur protein n=1 Tax=Actinocrispum wychmicini TaxID=1213861 RepID=A0A4R2JJ04_9PSEU|nr:(2Fe-2S)-binding protein [Actinocrispum wychmicini]TCO56968.1 FhuF-like iron-sulfur protein [Actinocrispum wychmicini]
MSEVPARLIEDRAWLDAQLASTAKLYPLATRATLGVLWWYSASMVLLGPAVSGQDPALSAVTMVTRPDGLLADARSTPYTGLVGPRLRAMLTSCVAAVSAVSGARERTLWAIATDSLANRMLWAGRSAEAAEFAAAVPELPAPRYVAVRGRQFVRRVSCCLIYQGTNADKCVSCPRQTPADRMARLVQQLG